MSDILLARKKALSSPPGETVCRDIALTVDRPLEVFGLGLTRLSGPIPEAMYPDDNDPSKVVSAVREFAIQEQILAETLTLTVSLELHDRVIQTGVMRFNLSMEESGMPDKIYGRSDFLRNTGAILLPGETYTLKSVRGAVDADKDTGLSHEFDLWARVDD